MKTPAATLIDTNEKTAFAVVSCQSLLFVLALLAFSRSSYAAELDWNNSGTDFNAKASYGAGTTAPSSASVEYFKTTETMQPQVTAIINTAGFNFSSSGYDITNVAGATLTLNGYGISATGATSSAAAAIYSSATGTNTIEVPVTLTSNNGTSTPTIIQAGSGGVLDIKGKVSGALGIAMTISGNSTIQLDGANDFSGTLGLAGASLGNGVATLALGSDNALGTSTLSITNSDTLTAVNSARNIGNATVFGANGIIAGSNDLTLSGSFTSSGSSSRTLTVSNTGATKFSGSVFLAPDNTTARGLIIAGSGVVNISAVIANNNSGNTLASPLQYTGSSTLSLTGNNSYTGTTTISSGTIKAAAVSGQSLGGTTLVKINSGGSLLMSAANQFNTTAPAPLTFTGVSGASGAATFKLGGFSQGSTTMNGVGALTLTTGSLNNVVDFGSLAGVVTFASLTTNSATLTINNYLGNGGMSGGSDQLIFNQDESASLGNIVFTGLGPATEQLVSGTAGMTNAFYEVFPTAVPEPTMVLGGILTVVALIFGKRRRLGDLVRSMWSKQVV